MAIRSHTESNGTMRLRVLLVDDSRDFLVAFSRFVSTLDNVEVVGQAHGGLDALTQAATLQPDLILLDITMPVFNGLEVARCIQGWPHAPRIVFLSMHDNAAYREVAAEAGAVDYVNKEDVTDKLPPILERLLAAKILLYAGQSTR